MTLIYRALRMMAGLIIFLAVIYIISKAGPFIYQKAQSLISAFQQGLRNLESSISNSGFTELFR